ncbi:MAG: FAD-dependent oxidoreductase [Spirochaetes bacterium]|nr:FAD-dependent oxidoreductase [Spirochaetota bacterium]
MAEHIKHSDQQTFEADVLKGGKVVVDFYSSECPPCDALAPKFEQLAGLYGSDVRFVKIFRQENRPLATSLGVSSSPTLLFFDNGACVGDKLTGGIKKNDIIRNLNLLVGEERGRSMLAGRSVRETETGVLIIGGGIAGLTAAIYLAQAKIPVIVVDRAMPGGQVSTTHQVSNYPGFIEPENGYMLMHKTTEQARAAGVQFRAASEISGIDLAGKSVVIDDEETIYAKKIIVATGASPRPLSIPGESQFRGHGISYCAICDAKYYQDKEVIVIGGGSSAVEEACYIAKFAKHVTIVYRGDMLRANKEAQEKAFAHQNISFLSGHTPAGISKEGEMMVLESRVNADNSMRRLAADGIFIFIGMFPNLELFPKLFSYDDTGYIKTDALMRTGIDGVYAVGDVASKPFRQITIAAAEGTVAALDISREIG